jgi:hypothetical protein
MLLLLVNILQCVMCCCPRCCRWWQRGCSSTCRAGPRGQLLQHQRRAARPHAGCHGAHAENVRQTASGQAAAGRDRGEGVWAQQQGYNVARGAFKGMCASCLHSRPGQVLNASLPGMHCLLVAAGCDNSAGVGRASARHILRASL